MSFVLDVFKIIFEGDASQVEKEAETARSSASSMAHEIFKAGTAAGGAGDKFKTMVKGAAGLIGVGLSLGAITHQIMGMAESYDKLDKLAARFRATTDSIDEFLDASSVIGVKEETATDGLSALDRAISDTALGMGRAKLVFEEIGVKALDAGGKMRPVTDVMTDLAAKMKGMERGKAIRVMERLGLDPALMKVFNADLGSIGGRLKQIDEAAGFNLGLTVSRSKEFMTAMRGMKQEVEYIKTFLEKLFESWGTAALPFATRAISNIAGLIRTVTTYLMAHKNFLSGVFTEMGIAITVYLLPAMYAAAAAAIATIAPFLLIGAVVAALGGLLALAYDDIMTFMEGGDSMIGRWAQKWPILGDIVRALVAQIRQFGDIAVAVLTLLVGLMDDPAVAWNDFVRDIVASEQRFQEGAAGITQAFSDMGDSVASVWDNISNTILAAIATLTGAIDAVVGAYQRAKNAVSGVVDSIKSGVNATVDVFGGQPAMAGGAMIAQANAAPVNAVSSSAISNSRTSSKSTTVSIDKLEVQTQATDADGISKSIGDSLGAQMRQAADHHDDGIAY